MQISNITPFILPAVVGIVVLSGFVKKVNIFDTFLLGAKEGLNSTVSILPSLVGLIIAVSMLRSSGALDVFSNFLSPITNFLHIPIEVVPLVLLRPVSGSGSLAFVDSIFSTYGVDSFVGRVASVMMGSTETTFYAIAVYFGAVGIKNTRHAIPAALLSDVVVFFMSILMVKIFFY